MNKQRTPIALFTYDRPDHTRRVLDSLARCARLDECRLYVFCDGPKEAAQAAGVAAVRQVVREWSTRLGAAVFEREVNIGLARSVVTGVTELCKEYGEVIVIEDDLELHPDFLDYMLQALDKYRHEQAVYQISGYMFPLKHPRQPDAFFLPLTTTWGWATWQRAWQIFDWNGANTPELLADPQTRRRFDLDGTYPYATMLESTLAGENDSWGILWWWSVFNARGLVLHPRRSFVWNGGFDGTGTHLGGESMQEDRNFFSQERLPRPLTLPDEAVLDEPAFARLKNFLARAQGAGKHSLAARLGYGLEKFIRGRSRI